MNEWQKVSIYASAVYPYQGKSQHQLSFEFGDEFEIFAANSKGWYRGFLLPERELQGLIPQTYVKIIHAGEGRQCSKCGLFGKEAYCGKCGNKMESEMGDLEELEELNEEDEDIKECEECKKEGEGVFCSECGGKMVKKVVDLDNLLDEVIDKDNQTILSKMISKIKRGLLDTVHVNFKICTQGTLGVQMEDDDLIDLIESNKLENTEYLNLDSCRRLSVRSIKELGKLKNLNSIDLSQIKDPNDYSSFTGSLKTIILKRSGITDDGISSLVKHNPNLTEIDLSFAPKITGKSLAEIGKLKKLAVLNLRKSGVDDNSLKHLSSLPLITLHLNECDSLTNEGIKHLAPISTLTYLDISHNSKLTGDSLSNISNLKKLSTFEFASINNVQDASLKHISDLNIVTLNINGSNFGTIGLGLICKMAKTLVRLDLGSSGDTPRKIDVKDLQLLGLLQNIEVLNLSGCQITPKADEEGFGFLANLKNVKELNVLNCLGCNVRGKALIEITKIKSLTKLSMNCKIDGDYGLNYLSLLSNLEYLEFKPPSEEVTKDGWKFGDGMKISTMILKNPHQIDDYAWDYLTYYSFEYVNVLWIESKLIKPETWKYFERLECLQNLHFGSAYFNDDENLSFFVDSLLKCVHLSKLSLKYEGDSVSKVTSAGWNKIKIIPKITVVKLMNFPRESIKDFDQYQEIE